MLGFQPGWINSVFVMSTSELVLVVFPTLCIVLKKSITMALQVSKQVVVTVTIAILHFHVSVVYVCLCVWLNRRVNQFYSTLTRSGYWKLPSYFLFLHTFKWLYCKGSPNLNLFSVYRPISIYCSWMSKQRERYHLI